MYVRVSGEMSEYKIKFENNDVGEIIHNIKLNDKHWFYINVYIFSLWNDCSTHNYLLNQLFI